MKASPIKLGLGLLAFGLAWYFFAPDLVFPSWVPTSARSVRSSEWGYGLLYEAHVRFEAPYKDCERAAEAVISAHMSEMPAALNFNYARKTIDVSRGLASPGIGGQKRWWFHPERIQRGFYYGQDSSHNPQIWIDTDKNVFYYKRTD